MGFDAGFDMVPQLSRADDDQDAWNLFIGKVEEEYRADPRMQIKPHYLSFNAGEVPLLPFKGFEFMRFSSKVSGSNAENTGVWDIIKTVTRMARSVFGSRIRYWCDVDGNFGHYDWEQVHASIDSYGQVGKSNVTETTASSLTRPTPSKGTQIPFYEVHPIAGKGKGLVALRRITMGTRILIERPILRTLNTLPALLEPTIARELKSLTKEKQRQFLSLHNNFPGKYPFSGIMKTNALPCGSGAAVSAVYPTICFINHSCGPNTHHSRNEYLDRATIHATRDIEPGEEITIPYDHGGSSASRRQWLKETFGFDCNCSICVLPAVELEKSDKRRERVPKLDKKIGDPICMMNRPNVSLENCRALLQVLKEEFSTGTNILVARANYYAFQIAIVHGDVARGEVFAERAYQVRLLCEGGDSPDTKRMQQLAKNPMIHQSFGAYSMRWKTKKGKVPSELSWDKFENWLWRQE